MVKWLIPGKRIKAPALSLARCQGSLRRAVAYQSGRPPYKNTTMQFHLRVKAPTLGTYASAEGMDLADAVGNFLETRLSECLFVRPEHGSGSDRETAYFALVDVQDLGEVVGRHFFGGIGRKGGVQKTNPRQRYSLAEVERDLGLAPGFLSETEWEGEESEEAAWDRKFSRSQSRQQTNVCA